MDQTELIQSFKDQGYSLKRTLFQLKIQTGELSLETMELIAQIYNVSSEQLFQIKNGLPPQPNGQTAKHSLLVCRTCQKEDITFINQLIEMIDTPIGSTRSDGLIRFDWIGCMGLCGMGPNAMLDQKIYNSIKTNPFFIERLNQICEERKSR